MSYTKALWNFSHKKQQYKEQTIGKKLAAVRTSPIDLRYVGLACQGSIQLHSNPTRVRGRNRTHDYIAPLVGG